MSSLQGSVPDPGIAFSATDAQPDPSALVASMEATAQWPAVRELRAWERQRLALQPGDRLLDVGCGVGDAAIALAADVSPGGRVVGIDASEAMLAAARERVVEAGAEVGFRRGDVMALDEDDASFDACRAERTLQWVADVHQAVAELLRVLRPGGRLSLIDTDWHTLAMDLPDTEMTTSVLRAMAAVRGPGMGVGGRLLNLCREAGLVDIDGVSATHVWTDWDPETSPAPPGLFPVRQVIGRLVDANALDAETGERFVTQLLDAARRDRLYISLTMVAVTGRRRL